MNANGYHLYASQRSPFARRIRLALKRLAIPHTEEMVDVFGEAPEFWKVNPLGMVPTLMTPDAGSLSDSSNILDYLHEKTRKLWPSDFLVRMQVKQASTWCAGVIQASVLHFQEMQMHPVPAPFWVMDHEETIERTLKHLVTLPREVWGSANDLTQAGWDLCVALQYLSLRQPHLKWWVSYPSLLLTLEIAQKNENFNSSVPVA